MRPSPKRQRRSGRWRRRRQTSKRARPPARRRHPSPSAAILAVYGSTGDLRGDLNGVAGLPDTENTDSDAAGRRRCRSAFIHLPLEAARSLRRPRRADGLSHASQRCPAARRGGIEAALSSVLAVLVRRSAVDGQVYRQPGNPARAAAGAEVRELGFHHDCQKCGPISRASTAGPFHLVITYISNLMQRQQ